MTVTLCIETSTAYCSLALADQNQMFCRHEKLFRRHNEQALPMLDDLYREAGIAVSDTELIGFGAGPGSFTGVRIAASVAQGIGMASGAMVVPLPGSEIVLRSALHTNLWNIDPGNADPSPADGLRYWLTVVPSRADAFYLAAYEQTEEGALSLLHDDRLYTDAPDWLAALPVSLPELNGLGPRPDWLDATIPFASQTENDMNAVAMIERVRQVHASGLSKPAQMALPIYVEGDSPWRKNDAVDVRTT